MTVAVMDAVAMVDSAVVAVFLGVLDILGASAVVADSTAVVDSLGVPDFSLVSDLCWKFLPYIFAHSCYPWSCRCHCLVSLFGSVRKLVSVKLLTRLDLFIN